MDITKVTEEDIKKIFKKREPQPEGSCRGSSVLALLFKKNSEMHILFTKRALTLKSQPGDVCFPGGKKEEGETPLEAALRETEEEIGITCEKIKILGASDYVLTIYGAIVTPFIGYIENFDASKLLPSPDEVDKVFSVPLKFFMENKPIKSYVTLNPSFPPDFPMHLIYGGENYKWRGSKIPELFYEYDGEVIWGLTARITRHICRLILEA